MDFVTYGLLNKRISELENNNIGGSENGGSFDLTDFKKHTNNLDIHVTKEDKERIGIFEEALDDVRLRLWEMSNGGSNLTMTYSNGYVKLIDSDMVLCNIYIGYSDADIDGKIQSVTDSVGVSNVPILHTGTTENPIIVSELPQGFCGMVGTAKSNPSGASKVFSNETYGILTSVSGSNRFTCFTNVAEWYVYNFPTTGTGTVTTLSSIVGPTLINQSSAQSIGGLKTFDVLPQSARTPSDAKDFTTKKYVDSAIAAIDGGDDTGYSNEEIDGMFDAERVITEEFTIGSGAISAIVFNLLKDTFCESGFPVHFDADIMTSELNGIYTQCNNFVHSKLVGSYGEMLENFMNSFREWIWYTIQNNPDPGNIKLISDEQFGEMFKYALLGISENQPGYEGSIQVFEELIERMIAPMVKDIIINDLEDVIVNKIEQVLADRGII